VRDVQDHEIHFAFDFYPLQSPAQTRIAPFFQHLREGRLTTTKCARCAALHWQPRIVCPACNADDLVWVDLPSEGRVFAFTAVYAGAPLGMEGDVPFVVGLVAFEGVAFKIVARIDDARYEDLRIGTPVRLKVLHLDDGRVWFRFVRA
jgi:uncharacterized OB-fold protein